MVEVRIATLAAERATDEDIAKLRAAAEKRAMARHGEYAERGLGFHLAIAEAAHHVVLASIAGLGSAALLVGRPTSAFAAQNGKMANTKGMKVGVVLETLSHPLIKYWGDECAEAGRGLRHGRQRPGRRAQCPEADQPDGGVHQPGRQLPRPAGDRRRGSDPGGHARPSRPAFP